MEPHYSRWGSPLNNADGSLPRRLGKAPLAFVGEAASAAISRLFKRLESVRDAREFGTVVALALVIVFFGLTTENFWSYDSLWSILSSSAIAVAVAAGMTAVIVARQIDLSIGAILGVAAYTVGVLLNAGVHPLLALFA